MMQASGLRKACVPDGLDESADVRASTCALVTPNNSAVRTKHKYRQNDLPIDVGTAFIATSLSNEATEGKSGTNEQ